VYKRGLASSSALHFSHYLQLALRHPLVVYIMPSAHVDFLKHNSEYVANFGDKGDLPLPPGKKIAIVTCMDARLDPAAHLGIKEGDAHVIRSAGGAAKEALRSIIVSQRYLGTREIAVFHHTGSFIPFCKASVTQIQLVEHRLWNAHIYFT